MVGRLIAEDGMSAFSVVVGDVVADFEPGFGQAGEAAAVEQLVLLRYPRSWAPASFAGSKQGLPGTLPLLPVGGAGRSRPLSPPLCAVSPFHDNLYP